MGRDIDRAMTPFSWSNPYAWPRKPLLAQNVVATSQPLAAQAGLQMLAAGGNAVDAILATAITLIAGRAGVERHRLGRVRARLGRTQAARAERLGPLAGRMDAGVLPRQGGDADARLGCGDRAGLRVGVGGAARQVRQAAVRANCSSRRSATAARASSSRRPSRGSGQRRSPN